MDAHMHWHLNYKAILVSFSLKYHLPMQAGSYYLLRYYMIIV